MLQPSFLSLAPSCICSRVCIHICILHISLFSHLSHHPQTQPPRPPSRVTATDLAHPLARPTGLKWIYLHFPTTKFTSIYRIQSAFLLQLQSIFWESFFQHPSSNSPTKKRRQTGALTPPAPALHLHRRRVPAASLPPHALREVFREGKPAVEPCQTEVGKGLHRHGEEGRETCPIEPSHNPTIRDQGRRGVQWRARP